MKLKTSKKERSGKSLSSVIVKEYTIHYEDGSDINYVNDDTGNTVEIQIDGWADIFATATRDILASDSTPLTPTTTSKETQVGEEEDGVPKADVVDSVDGVVGATVVAPKSTSKRVKK
jgi:hypothetical protein